MKITLGDKVKDQITGIEGVATARATRLHGNERILVEAENGEDGKEREFWFGAGRLSSEGPCEGITIPEQIEAGIDLNDEVEDDISGFKGKVTMVINYLWGCNRYEVTAEKLKDGKIAEYVFDEQRLTRKKVKDLGGPRDAPTLESMPPADSAPPI